MIKALNLSHENILNVSIRMIFLGIGIIFGASITTNNSLAHAVYAGMIMILLFTIFGLISNFSIIKHDTPRLFVEWLFMSTVTLLLLLELTIIVLPLIFYIAKIGIFPLVSFNAAVATFITILMMMLWVYVIDEVMSGYKFVKNVRGKK